MTNTPVPYGEVHGPPLGEMSRRTLHAPHAGRGHRHRVARVPRPARSPSCGRTSARAWAARSSSAPPSRSPPTSPTGRRGCRTRSNRRASSSSTCRPPSRWSTTRTIPSPSPTRATTSDPTVPPVDASVLALYRKCPHLGCQIPQLCDKSHWFECLCHGSQVHGAGREARRSGAARHGPLQRRRSTTTATTSSTPAELVDGPPIGTDTFDDRTDHRHAALHGLTDACQDARRSSCSSASRCSRPFYWLTDTTRRDDRLRRRRQEELLAYGHELFGPPTPRDRGDRQLRQLPRQGRHGRRGRRHAACGRRTCTVGASSRSSRSTRTTSTWSSASAAWSCPGESSRRCRRGAARSAAR